MERNSKVADMRGFSVIMQKKLQGEVRFLCNNKAKRNPTVVVLVLFNG